MTDFAASASASTTSGSRYVRQLRKHRSHKLQAGFGSEVGAITFPNSGFGKSFPADATVTLRAREDVLDALVGVSAPEQFDGVEGAVVSHLDRFAFREAPLPCGWR